MRIPFKFRKAMKLINIHSCNYMNAVCLPYLFKGRNIISILPNDI